MLCFPLSISVLFAVFPSGFYFRSDCHVSLCLFQSCLLCLLLSLLFHFSPVCHVPSVYLSPVCCVSLCFSSVCCVSLCLLQFCLLCFPLSVSVLSAVFPSVCFSSVCCVSLCLLQFCLLCFPLSVSVLSAVFPSVCFSSVCCVSLCFSSVCCVSLCLFQFCLLCFPLFQFCLLFPSVYFSSVCCVSLCLFQFCLLCFPLSISVLSAVFPSVYFSPVCCVSLCHGRKNLRRRGQCLSRHKKWVHCSGCNVKFMGGSNNSHVWYIGTHTSDMCKTEIDPCKLYMYNIWCYVCWPLCRQSHILVHVVDVDHFYISCADSVCSCRMKFYMSYCSFL